MTGVLFGLGGLIVLVYLRRLYQRMAKWPNPRDWSHPAGRIRRRIP